MAKVELNPSLNRISGRIGNLVYRRNGRGVALATRPGPRTTPPTAAQLAVQRKFTAAAAYAKAVLADPIQGPRYVVVAEARGTQPFVVAMKDFLKPPVVEGIDFTGYRGMAGDPVYVSAFDDFEVMSVQVSIRDAADAVLEQGIAILTEGRWRYTATTTPGVGVAVKLEATVTDRPGHTGSLIMPLTE